MSVRVVLKRFIVALLSLIMVFGVFPSFAATSCCDPASMAMQTSAPPSGHGTDQHHNMPCNMPAALCASMCASMQNVAVIAPAIDYVAPIMVADLSSRLVTPSGGISEPPALPPPIILS